MRNQTVCNEYTETRSIPSTVLRDTMLSVFYASLAPRVPLAIAALKAAKRADECLFAADASLEARLRRDGCCRIDSAGWLY